MKWKPMSDMTLTEIENLLKDIFGFDLKVLLIDKNRKENSIIVNMTSVWEDEEGKIKCDDELELTSDNFSGDDFGPNGDAHYQYKQYMIAKGYSKYWKDNPYVEKEVV